MWIDDDELRALSRGEVRKPDTYNYRTFLPENAGLYCSVIFGPVGWKEGELGLATDDRREHWGHIELPEPIARVEGPSRRVILVLPPLYRPFRVVSAEEHRAIARARRAELVALASTERWPYCDPLEKVLAEEGLSLPADIECLEQGAIEPAVNSAYRAVINRARTLRRLLEVKAPADALDQTRESLKSACARVDVEVKRIGELPRAVQQLALGWRPPPGAG